MHKNEVSLTKTGIAAHLLRVEMILRDVLYISYAVPKAKLLPLVPGSLELATVEGDTAFISLVIFQSTRVRLRALPFMTFDYYQFNIRTYVIDPVSGRNAVYFLRSGVTSRLISLATRSIGIPWEFIDLKVSTVSSKGSKCLQVSGNWENKIYLEARAASENNQAPTLFGSTASAIDFLVRPLIGFVGGGNRTRRFTIWHSEVQPEIWSLVTMECPVFQEIGAVSDYVNTHSVFYLSSADFSVFLPPKKITS